MIRTVSLVFFAWALAQKEHVRHLRLEIKFLDIKTLSHTKSSVKLVERVVIAMSAKVYVANLQGEQEASHKRFVLIMLTHKIALDQLQQVQFSELENLRQEKRG
jgi:hypothetical protein